MKYLKTFENNKIEKKYWLIPTDERFEETLKYLKCEDHYIIDNHVLKQHKYIFIILHVEYKENNNNNKLISWAWNPYIGDKYCSWCEVHDYDFQGTINISEYELDAIKYNI